MPFFFLEFRLRNQDLTLTRPKFENSVGVVGFFFPARTGSARGCCIFLQIFEWKALAPNTLNQYKKTQEYLPAAAVRLDCSCLLKCVNTLTFSPAVFLNL